MTPNHPNVYQILECFGVGLLVALCFVLLFVALCFFGKLLEKPVEAWFLRHPRAAEFTVRGGWTLIVCVLGWGIFYLGCSILEACR